ncbi:hypothetical protein EDB89DRAFT_1904822 [Lactarius sanguifluus]|nr:hypothetical protein EDB89DRAFT_1904822 [Lactarius sanguifluus]
MEWSTVIDIYKLALNVWAGYVDVRTKSDHRYSVYSSSSSGCGQNCASGSRSPWALVLPAHVNTGACSPRTSMPVSHPPTLLSKWCPAYQAKILIQIAYSLLQLTWDWVKRMVIGLLENLMRRMGWHVEATLTVRINITT